MQVKYKIQFKQNIAADGISRWNSPAAEVTDGSESVMEWHQKTLAGNQDEEDLEISNSY